MSSLHGAEMMTYQGTGTENKNKTSIQKVFILTAKHINETLLPLIAVLKKKIPLHNRIIGVTYICECINWYSVIPFVLYLNQV